MAEEREALFEQVRQILRSGESRESKVRQLADALRQLRTYRWVGIYDVGEAEVRIIAWSGPGAPEYPAFPIQKGLTGQAIQRRGTVLSNDVLSDPHYLTAFSSTQSEIIVPIISRKTGKVVGTVDVESVRKNAFSPEEQALLEAFAKEIRLLWI